VIPPGLHINTPRLLEEIDALAAFSSVPAPAVTRILFSPEDLAARAFLRDQALAAGLTVQQDAVGNVFFRWEGAQPELPPVATGSHIDAIPHAGKYDGVVGVLGGLEAIRALQESGFQPTRSIELIQFTAEEPTRFGLGCLGSRLLSHSLSPSAAASLQDADDKTLTQWLAEMAWDNEPLSTVPKAPGHWSAFVELHIEQGPLLEAEGLAIGIVEKIAAPAAHRLKLTGEGGHAGAVLMPDRHDAGLGAAEISLALEKLVLTLGSPDGVGTTGVLHLHPGAINSIPAEALLEIDLRDTDHAARQAVEAALRQAAESICSRRALQLQWDCIHSDPPALCDPGITQTISEVCQDLSLSHRRMVSRAYHDSLFLAQIAPTAMIFIPCFRGFSHRPDEFASPEAIHNGVHALAATLAQLSQS
jgi:ureidoglycolate amidohydrolase